MNHRYFITGIDTNCGKTLVSALLINQLNADYWKPIQSGYDISGENTDSQIIQQLTNCQKIHKEAYLLKNPVSPHQAAQIENINISLKNISLPNSNNSLIVEGAGGIHCPINKKQTMVDLIKHLNLQTIIVSKIYLGSINHTLLTIETLLSHNIAIKGIIFNGSNLYSESFITQRFPKIKVIGKLKLHDSLTQEILTSYQWCL